MKKLQKQKRLLLPLLFVGLTFFVFTYFLLNFRNKPQVTTNTINTMNSSSYNTKIKYAQNVALPFADFSLTYLGVHDVVKDNGMKVSLQTTDFSIVDNDGKEQTLKIGNGQLPNQPEQFEVNGHEYTLFTFIAPDGTRLGDGELVITQNMKGTAAWPARNFVKSIKITSFEHASDKEPQFSRVLTTKEDIDAFFEELSKLSPSGGGEMISFNSNVQRTIIGIEYDNNGTERTEDTVSLYNNKVRARDGTFYTEEADIIKSKVFVSYVNGLLQ